MKFIAANLPLVTDVYVFLVPSINDNYFLIEFLPELELIKSIGTIPSQICWITVKSVPPIDLKLGLWSCYELMSDGILEHSYADLVREDYIPKDFLSRLDSSPNIARFITRWNSSHGFKGNLDDFTSIFTIK